MIVARVKISGASAMTVWANPITSGMVGAQVRIDYEGQEWDCLTKTVVFSGSVVKDVISNDTVIGIPPECLAVPNSLLKIGVYGIAADNTTAIPTLWAQIGRVLNGTDTSGDTTTNPEPPVWAQILNIADEAKQLAQSVREDADAGVFDGKNGERGDAYFASFDVDDNGHLKLLGADQTGNVSFALNENGNLEVYYA